MIEPSTPFLSNWHIDVIGDHLAAVSNGEIRRLIVNIPPRYMKSIAVSVMWPTWTWTRLPERRWIFASYSQSLSTKHSIDRRTLIQSEWYQRRWGHVFRLAGDQNVKTEFQNDRRGHMVATSFRGTATGKGGDIIVIDDPLNPEEALSDIEREKANRIFDQTFTTRLDDKRLGAIVVIMQRLHEDDVTGHLLEKGGWEHLCLPAEYEPSHPFVWPDDPRSEPGELLWPEREGPEQVAAQRAELGSYAYAGQYQQRPAPAEGGILKTAWWRYFDPAYLEPPSPLMLLRLIQSWDTSWKEKTSSDYVVGTVWGVAGANRYLLRRVRERMGLPDAKRAIRETHGWVERTYTHLPHTVVVENTANGPDIVAALRNEIPGIVLFNVSGRGDKVQRAHAVSPLLEAGNVYVPGFPLADGSGPDPARTPGWVQEFLAECSAFPNASHDDQVDTMTQALIYLRDSPTVAAAADDEPPSGRVREAVTAGLLDTSF